MSTMIRHFHVTLLDGTLFYGEKSTEQTSCQDIATLPASPLSPSFTFPLLLSFWATPNQSLTCQFYGSKDIHRALVRKGPFSGCRHISLSHQHTLLLWNVHKKEGRENLEHLFNRPRTTIHFLKSFTWAEIGCIHFHYINVYKFVAIYFMLIC